ncbi:twin-arginine translocation pathway signal protein [Ramlibacter ginsenosidimutans]|uniref:Twin-arginine translocation pathway signal protein n=1 Tax=Ramlibacter ginsenosidimutans TaxID=502333 RepID=A0A934TS41_9BURK|nr:twin-arginine translocation pathway signal protein [Ramlibacter ginsenosidimutans]MBK6006581.1 twin-arginine translocation pathway signal protein [Ramlibacter ginsenosidimutans]
MDRRNFLRIAGGGVVLAAAGGCSEALPAGALTAWKGPAAGETELRRWVLSYALLAPHSHNLQSWRADLSRPGEILLSCDLARTLPETDPFGRQIVMSHGTFLGLLELAARERGHRAEIEAFPEGVFGPERLDTRPLARVRLIPDAGVRRDPLFAQVLRRHTNREAYAERAPSPEGLRGIADAAQAPGLRVGFTSGDAAQLAAHRRLASKAWRIELTTPRTILESYKWLRIGPSEIERHRDGISINAPMLRLVDAIGLFDRTKAPAPGDRATVQQLEDFDRKIATTPAFFWLVSEGNDRITQLRAGSAYVRAQLAATAHGLSMQPLSQALQEYPEQASTYAGIHALAGAKPGQTVQMWTRLGYGPVIAPAPRRGLQAQLVGA